MQSDSYTGKHILLKKGDRIGLYMIAASLCVIAVVAFLLLEYQRDAHESRIRTQGQSLARVMAGIPYDQVIPRYGQQGVLQALRYAQEDNDFAYGSVIGLDGDLRAEVFASGVSAPVHRLPTSGGTWLTEHERVLDTGGAVSEFQVPLLKDGKVAGFLRLGYLKPGILRLDQGQFSFVATLALLIFLLTPVFYFLIRREVRPLGAANERLSAMLADGKLQQVDITATGELGQFMSNFNDYVEAARGRVIELEEKQTKLLTKEKVLSYKNSRIESVMDALPEAIVMLDTTGEITYANKRIEALLGVSKEAVLGQHPSKWCNDLEVLDFLSRYRSEKNRQSLLSQTMSFAPSAASRKVITLKGYPLFSPTGPDKLLGTLVVFRDVTNAVAAQRSRGAFVAHVAHELKTPLNTLALYSELLQSDDGDDKGTRIDSANVINDEVQRLAGLIDNLLHITRIESGDQSLDRQHVKLKDLLDDAFVNISRADNTKQIKFDLDLPVEFAPIAVDKELMRIAVNNLLTNAVKYSDAGGTVTLSAEEHQDVLKISVRDQGIGISQEDQLRIFEKFYRGEGDGVRERLGHGLGLALAQQIVQLHNGTLSVESQLGEGSEFTISLWRSANTLRQVI